LTLANSITTEGRQSRLSIKDSASNSLHTCLLFKLKNGVSLLKKAIAIPWLFTKTAQAEVINTAGAELAFLNYCLIISLIYCGFSYPFPTPTFFHTIVFFTCFKVFIEFFYSSEYTRINLV
jgi:hypothetical protein